MKKELISQLKVILPLTALILFALLVWHGLAFSYVCIDFDGWPVCF